MAAKVLQQRRCVRVKLHLQLGEGDVFVLDSRTRSVTLCEIDGSAGSSCRIDVIVSLPLNLFAHHNCAGPWKDEDHITLRSALTGAPLYRICYDRREFNLDKSKLVGGVGSKPICLDKTGSVHILNLSLLQPKPGQDIYRWDKPGHIFREYLELSLIDKNHFIVAACPISYGCLVLIDRNGSVLLWDLPTNKTHLLSKEFIGLNSLCALSDNLLMWTIPFALGAWTRLIASLSLSWTTR
jgi:hypothetical protein